MTKIINEIDGHKYELLTGMSNCKELKDEKTN